MNELRKFEMQSVGAFSWIERLPMLSHVSIRVFNVIKNHYRDASVYDVYSELTVGHLTRLPNFGRRSAKWLKEQILRDFPPLPPLPKEPTEMNAKEITERISALKAEIDVLSSALKVRRLIETDLVETNDSYFIVAPYRRPTTTGSQLFNTLEPAVERATELAEKGAASKAANQVHGYCWHGYVILRAITKFKIETGATGT